jgi:hypothetical protein
LGNNRQHLRQFRAGQNQLQNAENGLARKEAGFVLRSIIIRQILCGGRFHRWNAERQLMAGRNDISQVTCVAKNSQRFRQRRGPVQNVDNTIRVRATRIEPLGFSASHDLH